MRKVASEVAGEGPDVSSTVGLPVVAYDPRRKIVTVLLAISFPPFAFILFAYVADSRYSWGLSFADTIPFLAFFVVMWVAIGVFVYNRQGHFEVYRDFVRCSRGRASMDIPYFDLALDWKVLRDGFKLMLISDKRQGANRSQFQVPNLRIESLNAYLYEWLEARVTRANLDPEGPRG